MLLGLCEVWHLNLALDMYMYSLPNYILFLCMIAYSYGLKTVNGVNRLSGEGLEAKDYPGMMQGGGKWPGR